MTLTLIKTSHTRFDYLCQIDQPSFQADSPMCFFPPPAPAGCCCSLIKSNLTSLSHSSDYWSGVHHGMTWKQFFLCCRMFFCLSYFTLCHSPEHSPSPHLICARGFTPGCWPLTPPTDTVWLIWILLSAGGTAACWERSAAWHLWKRSWGSKGWVASETQNKEKFTNTCANTVISESYKAGTALISVCSCRDTMLLAGLVKTIFATPPSPKLPFSYVLMFKRGNHQHQLSTLTNEPWMSWFLFAVHDWITRLSVANML